MEVKRFPGKVGVQSDIWHQPPTIMVHDGGTSKSPKLVEFKFLTTTKDMIRRFKLDTVTGQKAIIPGWEVTWEYGATSEFSGHEDQVLSIKGPYQDMEVEAFLWVLERVLSIRSSLDLEVLLYH